VWDPNPRGLAAVAAWGLRGRPGLTTTPAPRLRAIAAAGRPHSCCASKIRKPEVGRGSQMCFQERRARILFMFDVDMPKRSANALWVTLPFV